MIFFTADTHFGHDAIRKYCNRPFANVQEMNETIINNWNSVVGKQDCVYLLGDFGFGKPEDLLKILKQLNGNVLFVRGNHDKQMNQIAQLRDTIEVRIPDKRFPSGFCYIWLSHYAHRVWNKSHHGSFHLYGHSHGTLPETDSFSFDVGVDSWNFTPVSFEQVYEKMSKKKDFPRFLRDGTLCKGIEI
jgi:calcineurin-like phosphoesterase family protein